MSCGVGCRRSSDPELLWLWRRPVATAPIGPLAWEPPYAEGAAQRNSKKKTKKKMLRFINAKGESKVPLNLENKICAVKGCTPGFTVPQIDFLGKMR